MTHEIVWTLDDDLVHAEVACNAEPGTMADCRLTCPQGCESWSGAIRDSSGVWHTDEPWFGEGARHYFTEQDECNVVLFMGDDPSLMPELHTHRDSHEIGRMTITPVWEGEGFGYAVGSECR